MISNGKNNVESVGKLYSYGVLLGFRKKWYRPLSKRKWLLFGSYAAFQGAKDAMVSDKCAKAVLDFKIKKIRLVRLD